MNKGLTLFLWKQDIEAAERCYNEAFRIDPECEPAIEAVAQVNLRQGKLDKAVEMFDKQVQLARNEPELNNALMYKYVSGCIALGSRTIVDWSQLIGDGSAGRIPEKLS